MSGIAAAYATTTAQLDTFIADVAAELTASEESLASGFGSISRDKLADAKHRAEQARALMSDIVHRSLDEQSL